MSKYSIVCIYNDKNKYNNILLKSLLKQINAEYEIIAIDNTKNIFKYATKALNYACSLAKYENIIIIHQDILFKSVTDLNKIDNYLSEIDNFGVIGVAGRTACFNEETYTAISDKIPEVKSVNLPSENIMECYSVDECLFIIKKSYFKTHPFDEKNKTWHLYAVEYCSKAIEMGLKNYILSINLYHISNASSLNSSYFKELKRYFKNSSNKILFTTCGIWKYNCFREKIKINYLLYRYCLKENLLRKKL